MKTISISTAIFALVISGCSASYQVNNLSGGATTRLDRQHAVYVAVPQDGAYGGKPYPGSGQTVAQSVAAAFSAHAAKVHIAEQYRPASEAQAAAKSIGAKYTVLPTIAHWEQRATEWSGRPSKMSIRLTILDTANGGQITAASVEGRSRIVSWTSTSPESLLKEPLAQYVSGLY